jgi:glutathione synthase/RimK-type ligase-like ATP-grasp enzyme
MKLSIHYKPNDFSEKWIEYCMSEGIEYKIVNCYSNSIVEEVKDCDALLWHHNQANPKDTLFAKQLLYSLEVAGKVVFPDFRTGWFFDDKLGQKYLLESIDVPVVPTYVFFDKIKAYEWVEASTFPKVFKLRGGAGSANVRLAQTADEAKALIKQAFGRGFSQYDKWGSLKDRWYKYRSGKTNSWNVIKGVLRFGRTTDFARISGREKGYVYFQDFIPDNDFDIRIIVIGGKAFGIKRMVREGDFRASGSGFVLYGKEHFDEHTLRLSFEIAEKVGSSCLAIDYVYQGGKPYVVELSYGFIKEVYYPCEGYWDQELNWYPGPFNAQGWMIEEVVRQIRDNQKEQV